jgi:hypothetical protein
MRLICYILYIADGQFQYYLLNHYITNLLYITEGKFQNNYRVLCNLLYISDVKFLCNLLPHYVITLSYCTSLMVIAVPTTDLCCVLLFAIMQCLHSQLSLAG